MRSESTIAEDGNMISINEIVTTDFKGYFELTVPVLQIYSLMGEWIDAKNRGHKYETRIATSDLISAEFTDLII